MRKILLPIVLLGCAFNGLAQVSLPMTETVEWTWNVRPDTTVPTLPNVLLVGDSIAKAYYPATANELRGVANVYLFSTSACDADHQLTQQLQDYFKRMGLQFAVIHFNNGMHGWPYTEPQYAAGIPEMIAAIRAGAPHAVLVWANTTPVLHQSADKMSTNTRVDERNRLAAIVMQQQRIAIDDQHALMLKHPEMHAGDVHFSLEGSALQAAQAAASIRAALGKQ